MTKAVPLDVREGFMRLLLGKLVPKPITTEIPVIVIPTMSVRLSPVKDFLQLLNVSQDVFRFYASSPLKISRTTESNFRFCVQQPSDSRSVYEAATRRYISQHDYHKQVDEFLKFDRNYDHFAKKHNFVPGTTPVIIIGKERFIWDAEGYVITGDFEKDGYTALYSLEENDKPHNNICAISIEKLLIDEANISREVILSTGLEKSSRKSQRQLVERVYVSANIAHFLLAYVFNCSPSEGVTEAHEQGCIMDLNLDGGLDVNLAENRICNQCSAKLEESGLPSGLSVFLSAKTVERAALCLTQSVRRVIVIEQIAARTGKLAAWLLGAIVIAFLVSIVSNVPYKPEKASISGIIAGFFDALWKNPPTLALWTLGVAMILFLILSLVSVVFHWITNISRIEI